MNLLMSLPKLRHVRFHNRDHENNTVVELNAPSLLSFSFDGYLPTNFSLTNLSSLVTVDIKIDIHRYDQAPRTLDICEEKKFYYGQHTMGLLRGLHNVKVLSLNHSFLKALGGAPAILAAQHLEFYNLQRLEIRTYLSRDCLQSIFYLLKISPKMESFSLQLFERNYNVPPLYPFCDEVKINPENIGDYWEAELSLPCMIRHLKFVEVKGISGCVDELKFLEILLKHAMVLEKVVLTSYYSTKEDSQRGKRMTKFSEILQMFPRASKSVILLFKVLSKVTLPKFFLKVDR
ncbi:hypothetical protein MKX03_018029 [Papaver bracteatum]|nr:hypothetical protein MKX03_018029 [Papaver bracteatum]